MEEIEKLILGIPKEQILLCLRSINLISLLIEGDGSFSYINLSKDANFSRIQKGNKDLLMAIAEYLQSLLDCNLNIKIAKGSFAQKTEFI